jgi:hypothetical protein
LATALSGNDDNYGKENSVNKDMEIKLGSLVVARINSARMSESERQVAINAMRDADLLVDAFVWIVKKIEQGGTRLFLKPALKH